MNKSIYEDLKEERREHQEKKLLPEWFTTNGYQMFKEKYLWEADSFKDQVTRIAKTAAKHTDDPNGWETKFFDIIWNGWLACSTPVLANMGTNRGLPVSCSSSSIEDSIYSFYNKQVEIAQLSKYGFGTASYLGNIRPRGSKVSSGGTASGVLPVFKDYVQLSRDVSQANIRRGAWAGYLEIDHDDFWELINYLVNNPDDANIGWIIKNDFIERLEKGDSEAVLRYQRALKVKCVTGKGYFWFVDKVNNLKPDYWKEKGLVNIASNLCSEIDLPSTPDLTFTCILSSLNLSKYDEWKDTDTVFNSTVFLDCVAQEFIEKAKNLKGLECAVEFTKKARALGLGTLGFHTYLQKHRIALESLDAHFKNIDIYRDIHDKSLEASQWMAKKWGEPEWCKGVALRGIARTAIAPNSSSALICGSVSQGIEPIYKNIYTQGSAAGEMNRINPVLLEVMKGRGVYDNETIESIIKDKGSIRNQEWLDDHEKLVFKTAFEVDQKVLIRLASSRQKYICQAQSLNLFFAADESEEYISEVHKEAFLDPNIKSLYYLRSLAGVYANKECLSCEG